MSNHIWNSKFLGELDSEKGIYINRNNDVQFKIKILSSTPSDFPLDIKWVNGFSDDLEKFGYIDRFADSEEERIENVKNFLKDYYLTFSVRESEHSDNAIDKTYYNSFDISVIRREGLHNSNTFFPIPLFLIRGKDVPLFLEKIAKEKYIGKNNAISLHHDDNPSFIFVGEKEEGENINDIENFHVMGFFTEMQYKEQYGIKLINNVNLKTVKLRSETLGEYYPLDDGVMFLTSEKVAEVEGLLSTGSSFEVTNESSQENVEDINEIKFLDDFENVCKSKGLIYSKQDLNNFHTAMKTQSFVILAGMSGTGKSQLVQCYYEALNQSEANTDFSKFLFIPVRPFWQDDSDLLGYLDTLNGIYRPGDSGLVDFIIESTKNQDECFIVCLDEMNLARVEHYFSQFLSILERDPAKRALQLYNPKMDGRVYNRNEYPPEIQLGQNLFFVGTVNVDESTFQFSDKVLDRANVINLNMVNFKDIKKEIYEYKEIRKSLEVRKHTSPNSQESLKTFIKFQGMKKDDKKRALSDQELDLLWELHTHINKINGNLGVGMRIVNQIEQYMMNLPDSDVLSREEAFDIQISQRIFTKLRGSEGQLIDLVGKINDGALENSILINDIFDNYKDVSSFKNSIKKLKLISRELSEYGHTL